jgi:hypothetical protein
MDDIVPITEIPFPFPGMFAMLSDSSLNKNNARIAAPSK